MDIEEYSKYKQLYNEDIPKLLLSYLSKEVWNDYLDLGCGDGSLLNALDKKGYFNKKNVYAIDLSENRINLVEKINPLFTCYTDDACNAQKIKNNSIDFLVSEQVIEHVPSDKDMVNEIYRILKKNGTVYLSTVFKKWYGWYFYRCNGKLVLDPTHLREYTKDSELLDFFTEKGFKVLENKKSLVFFPIIDSIVKRLHINNETFYNNKIFKLLRKIKRPVPGYYIWEIVLKKNDI